MIHLATTLTDPPTISKKEALIEHLKNLYPPLHNYRDHYEWDENTDRLAKGGFGVVFKAHKILMVDGAKVKERLVAVKRFNIRLNMLSDL
jgi:hypothetical protein